MTSMNETTRAKLRGVSTATIASALFKRGLRSQMVQGVVPLAHLLTVPRVLLPSVEYFVTSAALPAAGPEKAMGVRVCTRRLKAEPRL